MSWDKNLIVKLVEDGFTREQAGQVAGIVAEERMRADCQGYQRGYNDGYHDCRDKEFGVDK